VATNYKETEVKGKNEKDGNIIEELGFKVKGFELVRLIQG
jgi:hypothetical protein